MDASVWVAAAGSEFGGSAEILGFGTIRKCTILASPRVLQEAEGAISKKFGQDALARYYQLLADAGVVRVDNSTADENVVWQRIITEKDRHVLAAAFRAEADIVVTLDKQHLLTNRVRYGFPILVLNTKQAIDKLESEITESN